MQEVSRENPVQIAPLFENWEETMLWSFLQGKMGRAWRDGEGRLLAAKIVVGDFCFFAGAPNRALAEHFPVTGSDFLLLVPKDDAWTALLAEVHPHSLRLTRYATRKEPDVFDENRLRSSLCALPKGYTIRRIDKEIYHSTFLASWSRDLCGQFSSYADYERDGLGFAVLHGGELVCGASSYTVYDGGIEIEIDTREDHRRRGLARACAARLILACLAKGLYPSWDAANPASLHLAESLGYRFDREYTVFEASAPAYADGR